MRTDVAIRHIVKLMEMDEDRGWNYFYYFFLEKKKVILSWVFLRGIINKSTDFFFFSGKAGRGRLKKSE